MKLSTCRSLAWAALACFSTLTLQVRAQDADPSDQAPEVHLARLKHRMDDNDVVNVGGNSTLEEGQSADSVVSVFGSSTSAGDVSESVVSIFGNSRVTGSVGDSVVAVAGDVSVNGTVHGQVVAVLGDIELGPLADIRGDVIAVGGVVKRDPAAVVHGSVQRVFDGLSGALSWTHPWVEHALLYGRPLAIAPGLGWAWRLALGFLALYLVLALLFRGAVNQCVETLETQPGRSLLAALLTVLITPIAFVILCITIIGMAVVPFLAVGLFCAVLFGKTVMLAALGRRVTRSKDASLNQTLLAVLVGGVIVLALYLIPFVGFIIYKLLEVIGLGVIIYTLILTAQRPKQEQIHASAAAGPGPLSGAGPQMAATAAEPGTGSAAENPAAGHSEPPPPADAPAAAAAAQAAPSSATNTLEATGLRRAGFWIRMGALTLDTLLVGIVLGILWNHSFKMELLVLATYAAVMWKLRGTTIGGVVFNLKIVRLDGRAIDWATAIVRALACFLSLAAMGLGFLWIVFDAGKQAWHDKIAGTVVVRVPKGVSLL